MNNLFLGKEGQEFESGKEAYFKKSAEWKKQDQEEKERLKRERNERRSLANIRDLELLRFKHCYKATDAGVVYGYARYQNAFAFFWFRINHLRREHKLRRCKKIFYRGKYQFTHACKNYEEAVNNHNQRFTTKVTFVPINVYFDDVYYEQLSISGKLSNSD